MGGSVASGVQITHTQNCSFVLPPQHFAVDEIRRVLRYTDTSQHKTQSNYKIKSRLLKPDRCLPPLPTGREGVVTPSCSNEQLFPRHGADKEKASLAFRVSRRLSLWLQEGRTLAVYASLRLQV
ncbi:hypothetical protein O3P69_003935 [Scylla paramamosain]|uniref:Uncharacterized protein n=1 Tax=Scylla paramamosain TaxID=85552 RepID=A0AAW0UFZ5_SCYPA